MDSSGLYLGLFILPITHHRSPGYRGVYQLIMITVLDYSLDQHDAIKQLIPVVNHCQQDSARWICVEGDVYSMDRATMKRRLARLELALSEGLKATTELLEALKD